MRRRLLLVLLVLSLAALTGFAVPLLASTSSQRTQRFVLSRTADLDRFAELAAGNRERLVSEVRAYVDLYGDAVVVVDARRVPVVEAGMPVDDGPVQAALDRALRNEPAATPSDVRPWSSGPVLFARPVGSGTRVTGAVVLRSTVDKAAADIAIRWLLVLSAALVVAVAFVAIALLLARWVLRPVAALERGVRAVAAGERGAHVRGLGPPELRGLAESFNRMSDAVTESAQRQRALLADTSHQLRNPLAAMRLRMDSLAGSVAQDGRRAYESMVTESDRLESLLDGLLAMASADTAATELASGGGAAACDASTIAAERVEAWRASADAAGVTLTLDAWEDVTMPCAASELEQVLDVLLDNAIKYAPGGRVAVRVVDDLITVSDSGPGVSEKDLPKLTARFWRGSPQPGTGLGLAIADRLVTARGGTLSFRSENGLVAEVRW